jgi:serine/threonine protein phosphatase 1
MLRLFNRSPKNPHVLPRVPDGQRVYAIGDIHGRDDLFATLIDMIAADDHARTPADTTLILLGDLVDRGPDSASVVERAIQLTRLWPRFHWLTGNHEEVFVEALDGGDTSHLRFFIKIGGAATIHSYGITGDAYRAMDFAELAEALRAAVPKSHREFLRSGEDMVRIGDYLFVHAGIRPKVAIENQSPSDLRWIRHEFLNHAGDHGAVVVHGHSIAVEVDCPGNRIGIDTGAYETGVLTAIGLDGTDRWFLATERRN